MAGTVGAAVADDDRWVCVGTGALVASVVCVLPVFLTAALAVQIKADLRLSPSALGFAPAAFFGAMVIGSPLAGRAVAALGVTRAIRLTILLVATTMVLVALTAYSLPALLAVLALAGFANSLSQPATNHLVATRIPWRRQGTAYGAKYSAIPIASMLSGAAVPVLGLTLGWRSAYLVFAVLAVFVALWPFGAVRTPPAATKERDRRAGRLPRSLMVCLAVGIGFAAAGGSSLAIFMVASAVEAGWSEARAGVILAVASAVGIVARLASGVRADRRGRNHLRFVAAMLVIGGCGVLGMAFGGPVGLALCAPVAFAAGWGWPGVFILSVVRLNPGAPAAATGGTQIGTSAGCVVGPLLMGLVVEAYSYTAGWILCAVLLFIAAAILAVVRLRVRRHVTRDSTTRGETVPTTERTS